MIRGNKPVTTVTTTTTTTKNEKFEFGRLWQGDREKKKKEEKKFPFRLSGYLSFLLINNISLTISRLILFFILFLKQNKKN